MSGSIDADTIARGRRIASFHFEFDIIVGISVRRLSERT